MSTNTPRLRLTYPTPDGERELPWVVGVLADLADDGRDAAAPLRSRAFAEVTADTLDDVLRAVRPALRLETSAGPVTLAFERLADFRPEAVARQIPALQALADDRDVRLDEALTAILHHPRYQRLEATWRGLAYLLSHTGPELRVRVLDVSKAELRRDLSRVPSVDQSALYKKLLDDVYGVTGAAPFGMLVGDYEFGEFTTDFELLGRLAEVAAAGHTPLLAGAAPKLFGVDRFADLPRHDLAAATFDDAAHAAWRAFRERPESRYVTLAMPRVLLREPFEPTDALDYQELASASRPESYLWGNAAWVLAAHVNRAMTHAGWGAAIRGPSGGGRTDDLPTVPTRTAAGAVVTFGPTDARLDDLQEHAVAAAGIAPLAGDARGAGATFFSVPTCRRPEPSEQFATAVGEKMWAQLPYVLASARVAQHLMAMVRDLAPTRATDAATVLNAWLARLVELPDPQRPLAEGRLELRPLAGRPDRHAAVAYLNPRFQLEPLPAAMPLPVILPYL